MKIFKELCASQWITVLVLASSCEQKSDASRSAPQEGKAHADSYGRELTQAKTQSEFVPHDSTPPSTQIEVGQSPSSRVPELESFAENLSLIGQGRDRTELIEKTLARIADNPTAYDFDALVEFFRVIDENSYRDDMNAISNGFTKKIIQNLGLSDSVKLLHDVESSPVRRTLAYEVGRLLADNPESNENFATTVSGLPDTTQAEIFGAFGDRQDFSSASQALKWSGDLRMDERNRIAAVEAALNSSNKLEPYEVISLGLEIRDEAISKVFFSQGLKKLYRKDSLETSEYLLSIRDQIPDGLFEEGAKIIAARLQSVGDFDSAARWREVADK